MDVLQPCFLALQVSALICLRPGLHHGKVVPELWATLALGRRGESGFPLSSRLLIVPGVVDLEEGYLSPISVLPGFCRLASEGKVVQLKQLPWGIMIEMSDVFPAVGGS
ncbi:hypothetical protein B0T19DRAFT_244916 [Cercophora scortea]|uniref:Uncharacterized protein n=1 Tax=Cercophora scortea TaxID=314031 RepID=A0AAE0M7D6_9PEZI|nr:hypothetical protein B0T19DRAFT_244916 [Cercophora scortea]